MLAPRTRDQLFDRRQNARDNLVDSGRRGMDPVRLVEARIRGDAIQKERINDEVVAGCVPGGEIGKDCRELPDVFQAKRPADAVSPETPALAISTAAPFALSAASSLAGKDALSGSPSPAVSESPSATMRTGRWGAPLD